MNVFEKYFKGDKVIWIVVTLLSIISILTVYSSIVTLAYKYKQGDTFYYLFKHLIIILVGFVLIISAHNVQYKYYSRISQIALYLSIPLLLLTLITGANINDASRWLVIPVINQSFQTSDLAKLALIMYLARMLSKHQDHIKDFKQAFVPIMAPVLIVCALILPANFSTAAMLFTTSIIIMFIGRINVKYILSLIGIAVVAFAMMLLIAKSYPKLLPRFDTWVQRIESFSGKDSETNYQAEQAKIAIATGGIIGKGPGKSTQRNFLPHPYSDFIYAIILEEYGLLGGLIVLFLYLVLFYRGVKIANKAERTFGTLLAAGLSFSLVFQAMINMAVAVNLFPVTGQPLPLVSMGGTSIWFTCLAIGIILSVSNNERKKDNLNQLKNA
ncbi:MAG: FtsW/RodA/SpoVE family cell cycle protein [Vicingaceae bacterium]